MKQKTLGKTGLQVSELGLGGLFISALGGDFEQSRKAVHRAVELGVTYIDTAPTYSNSEEVLGQAMEGLSAPAVLSTKLGGRPQPFLPQDRDCLMRSLEESLRLLKRDTIDILFVHEPDRPGQYDWWSEPERCYGPVCDLLDDLKRQGIIRFTGLGGTTAYPMSQLLRVGNFDVVLTAFNYSLLWREAEHVVLPAAREQNMGVVAGSPLQQGALARRYDAEIQNGADWLSPPRRAQYQALYTLLDEVGMPLPELALRFVISNPDIDCVLMGARSEVEVEKNVASVEKGPLPPDILARLDAIAAMVPFRPFDEPAGMPFGRPYRGPGAMR